MGGKNLSQLLKPFQAEQQKTKKKGETKYNLKWEKLQGGKSRKGDKLAISKDCTTLKKRIF